MQKISDEQNAQISTPKFCINKHELIKTKAVTIARAAKLSKQFNYQDAHIFCDICHEIIFMLRNKSSKEDFYTCEECEFDVCKSCFISFK